MYDRDGIGLPLTFVNYAQLTRSGEQKTESGRLVENRFYRNTFAKKK